MNKYFLILALLTSATSFAGLNKWVDENGKVHYSDQPPPSGVQAETLRPAPAPATDNASGSTVPAAPKTIAEREAEFRKAQQAKKEAADKAAKEQAIAETDKANCTAAQQNLRTLQADMRLTELNEKGERSYLSDEQRQQRIAKAQQDISTFCK